MSTPVAPTGPPAIDFARSFRFLVEDADWVKKVLIGGLFALLSFLIVGAFFVAGYWVRFLRRVAAGEPRPLPEWDDLGGIFKDGLKLLGAYLVYTAGVFVAVASLGCAAGLVALGIDRMSRVSDGAASGLAALGGLGIAAGYGLFMLLALVLACFLPAVFVRVAIKDRFAEAFAFRELFAFLKANLGNYALSLVLYLVASFLAQFGALVCCLGLFPAVFWSYLVLGHALGETVRLNPGSL